MIHIFPIRMEYKDNFAIRRKTLAQTRSFSTRFYYFVKRGNLILVKSYIAGK